MRHLLRRGLGLALAAVIAAASGHSAEGAGPRELRAQAADDLYNLDWERAARTYRLAIAADPSDAAAHRGLASALWIGVGFRRGTITVDSYLGRVSRSNVKLQPPPPEVAAEFQQSVERAITIARSRLERNERDPDALFELGSAVGLRASYSATVEGSVRAAFGAAREAFNRHEQVLEIDPRRLDAGLVVGTYRYLVSGLAMPVRWVAYVAGFGGGREKGLQLIEAAAEYPGENQTDARLALVLLYNREQRYADALRQLDLLRARYPRNRLLWLESGATALRAGRHRDAERFLDEGLARLAQDDRPRMFGEEAFWYYKRGAARAGLGRSADAAVDLRRAVAAEGRKWVRGRAYFELGKLSLKSGDRQRAGEELRQAIELCEADDDQGVADEARRLLRSAR